MDDANLDAQIDQFLDTYINDALTSLHFQTLEGEQKTQKKAEIKKYFEQVINETIVDHITDEQVDVLSKMDLDSTEAEDKLAQYAAEIPGFIFTLQDVLQEQTEQIKQSGQIPTDQIPQA